jgi:hypothetical protein
LNTPEQFWSRVHIGAPTECWEWQGAQTSAEYGCLVYQGLSVVAHRLAYSLVKGGISLRAPADKTSNEFVLHGCDNRRCCNPAHLHLGTFSDNQKEAYLRKRRAQPKGAAHVNAKLTSQGASSARVRYALGETQQAIADDLGVSQRVISLIIRRESYK